jgi:hypothetical protein
VRRGLDGAVGKEGFLIIHSAAASGKPNGTKGS